MSGSQASPQIDALAGGIAGAVTKTVIAPIDRVKLLLQTQRALAGREQYAGIVDCFRRIRADEGVLAFWRGNGVAVQRHAAQQALTFSCKDRLRVLLGAGRDARGSQRRRAQASGWRRRDATTPLARSTDAEKTRRRRPSAQ